jgi:hypothetical protein
MAADDMEPLRHRVLQAAGCAAAILAVAAIRWWMRLEPLNSDDLALFEYASDAAAGQHWLFTSDPRPALGPDLLCLSCQDGGMSHQSLRIGLLPVAIPILWMFGRGATAYYLVPLFFSLLGVAAVWLLARRNIGARAAWVVLALHAVMPYELMHAGRFFVDLPAAVCLLLAILAIGTAPERSTAHVRGVAAGVFLIWAYLLRANSPLLLAPGLGLLFLRQPRYRSLLSTAAVVFIAGWLAEQVLYVSKGFEFGFRATILARAVEAYTPFLPLYSPTELLARHAVFFWKAFHGWPHGFVACAFVLLNLVSQVWIVIRGRNETIRLVATMGLVSWVAVAYSIFEWSDAGIRAVIPSFRYLQPFFYAALLCLPVAGARGLDWMRARIPELRPFTPAAVFVCVATVAVCWCSSDLRFPQRLNRQDRHVRTTLKAIDRVATGEPLELWSTCLQGRVVSLFTDRLGPIVANRSAALVLRDATRELVAHRYRPPAGRERALAASAELDRALWAGYRPSHITPRYVLFVPSEEGAPGVPLALANVEVVPPGAALRREDAGVTIHPDDTAYVFSGAAGSFHPEIELCTGCRYSVRAEVDLSGAITGHLLVQQFNGMKYTGESRQQLRTGENYMPWQGLAGADRFRVGLRLQSPAGANDSFAMLREVEVKRFGNGLPD